MLRSFISSVPRPPRISPRLRATRRPLRGVAQPTSREGTEIERHLAKTLQREISSEPDTENHKKKLNITYFLSSAFSYNHFMTYPAQVIAIFAHADFFNCFLHRYFGEKEAGFKSVISGERDRNREGMARTLWSFAIVQSEHLRFRAKPLCSVYVCTV